MECKMSWLKFVCSFFPVPNIEEEAADLAKDGWIQRHDFLRFACTTELLKVEFQDRVFQKVQVDDKKDDRGSKKDSKKVGRLFLFKIKIRIETRF